jgi:hypothetical protein
MDGGMTTELNQLAHLQTEIAHAYMRRHKLSPKEFIELDREYSLLRYIEIGYEPFHLTGTQGVVDELEDYIRIQRK